MRVGMKKKNLKNLASVSNEHKLDVEKCVAHKKEPTG